MCPAEKRAFLHIRGYGNLWVSCETLIANQQLAVGLRGEYVTASPSVLSEKDEYRNSAVWRELELKQ